MATSGQINTNTYNFSYFYLAWQLAGQSVSGDYSVLNWQWGINLSNEAHWGSSAVKSVSGFINGAQIFGGNTWSNLSGNGNHQLLSSSITVPHNADGTKTFGASQTGNLFSYGNTNTASGSWDLPAIATETANILTFVASDTTDTSFNLAATTDHNAAIAFSIDGGASYTTAGSVTTSANHTFTGLTPGTIYTCFARAVDTVNSNTTFSGALNVTTTVNERLFFAMFTESM